MKKMRWSEAPLPDSDHGGINHHTSNGNGNANGRDIESSCRDIKSGWIVRWSLGFC